MTLGSDYSRTDEAFAVWADTLLGRRENPGKFRVYWVWFDYVTNGPDGVNRYIFHASDFDVWASDRTSFAVAHVPGLFLIGVLEDHHRSEFRGLDISFGGGQYNAKESKTAPSWLQSYILEKMAARQQALDEITPAQQQKIDDTVLKDPERALSSLLFRTVLHDRKP